MSEFSENLQFLDLLPPPGYIGYDKGGELTEKIRETPTL